MIFAGVFALKIKCRKCLSITPFVVPDAFKLGYGKGFRVNILSARTRSFSLNPLVISDFGALASKTLSPAMRVVLMSMKPIFSAIVICEMRSWMRASVGNRQSSYLSSFLFLFKSLNCIPSMFSISAERQPNWGCIALVADLGVVQVQNESIMIVNR